MPQLINYAFTAFASLFVATMGIAVPMELVELMKREPPKMIPANATANELKWQPAMDFDKDGCYNTPAIDINGNIATGMTHNSVGAASGCRDASDLDNNNVYVRTRCNNGWCAYMYDYYFEKDVAVEHVADAGGHRHDWEHVVIFIQPDSDYRVVAVSRHGGYDVRWPADKIPWSDGTHAKVVYHKDGGSTHALRFEKNNEKPENHKGVWFLGPLIGWESWPSTQLRDRLANANFGDAHFGLKDASYAGHLRKVRDKFDWGFGNFDFDLDGVHYP